MNDQTLVAMIPIYCVLSHLLSKDYTLNVIVLHQLSTPSHWNNHINLRCGGFSKGRNAPPKIHWTSSSSKTDTISWYLQVTGLAELNLKIGSVAIDRANAARGQQLGFSTTLLPRMKWKVRGNLRLPGVTVSVSHRVALEEATETPADPRKGWQARCS